MNRIKELMKKIMTREVILYFVFGGMTTIVNWVTFYILNAKLNCNENVANIISIIVAVILAYITNKDMVFHSQAKGIKEKILEFWKFMLGRAFTMVLEWVAGALLFLTPIPKMVSKVVITIVIVIINFFFSKYFAFKQK